MDPRLLEPGWPGELASDELTFVKNSLNAERRLRTQWGFVRGTGRVSEAAIRSVAMRGLPDNRWHNTALVKGCRGLEVAPSTAFGGVAPEALSVQAPVGGPDRQERPFPEPPGLAGIPMLGQQNVAGQHRKASPGAEHGKSTGGRKARWVKTMLGPGQVYCLRCKAGRELVERVVVGATQKGAQVVQGRCATCDMRLVTFEAAARVGQAVRVAADGEASASPAEEFASPRADGLSDNGETLTPGPDVAPASAQQPVQLAFSVGPA